LDTAFLSLPPIESFGATYIVYLKLIGKLVVGFLFVIIDFFVKCYRWGATSENRMKSAFCKGVGQYPPNFRVEGEVPCEPLLHR